MGVRNEPSGVHVMPLADVLVERRRQIAWTGFEAGRWSLAMAKTADSIAARHDLPPSEDSWCALLDELEVTLRVATLRACSQRCEEKERIA